MAYAIRMLGFDETTKKGNPSITSNVIIEPEKGAPLEPVILRGAYCSADWYVCPPATRVRPSAHRRASASHRDTG